jgi:hypothetical protein
MGHRAAVYTVKVRRKRDLSGAYMPLGDIDGQGTSLLAALDKYMSDLEAVSADGSKVVRCNNPVTDGIELRVMAQTGQSGVASDLVGPGGNLLVHRTAHDTELLRCGCLFRLPSAEETGWLAAHINNGQGVKGLVEKELRSRFNADFSGLMLEITPYVLASALREAIEHDRIDKVKLVKKEQPNDRANTATDKWVRAGVAARIELQISPRARTEHVITRLLRMFVVDENPNVFGDIVEFEGITFDEAKVEVETPSGAKRTFNIERPDSGHPVTEDLHNLTLLADGSPDEASLYAELRQALSTVVA